MRLYLDESVQLWLKVTFNSCHVWERRPAARCPVYNSEWNARLAGERGSTRLAISQLAQNICFFFLFPPPHTPPTPLQAMKADAAQMVNRAAAHIKMPRCVNIYIPHQSPSALIPPRAALGIHLWLTLIHMFVWGKLRGGVACHGSVALDFISCCSVCTFWRYANMPTRECRGMLKCFEKIKKK